MLDKDDEIRELTIRATPPSDEELIGQLKNTISLIPIRARQCVSDVLLDGACSGNVMIGNISTDAIKIVAGMIKPILRFKVVAQAVLFMVRMRRAIDNEDENDSDSDGSSSSSDNNNSNTPYLVLNFTISSSFTPII